MPHAEFDTWPPTREEGLRRLEAFLPRAGRDYAIARNEDRGPRERSNISTLSPYIRSRLILEGEVVRAVVERHGPQASEKFVQEVLWRTYWKGWLELRPSVWTAYRKDVRSLVESLETDGRLRDRYEASLQGRSGIVCLDAWASELVETGYLHNHARMWFASLWIFTLKLPWQLGADFFLRHLLDGDPASNTLSWRWVAGLQTRGKTYLATAENIARYTLGRFVPTETFAHEAFAVEGPDPPSPKSLARRAEPVRGEVGLLLTEEDLNPESLPLGEAEIMAVAGLSAPHGRSPLPVSPAVETFAAGAVDDGIRRASAHLRVPGERLVGTWEDAVVSWARSHGLSKLVTAYAPVGPVAERLDELAASLLDHEIELVTIRREWDDRLWPLATHGYFPFKQKLPSVLKHLSGHP